MLLALRLGAEEPDLAPEVEVGLARAQLGHEEHGRGGQGGGAAARRAEDEDVLGLLLHGERGRGHEPADLRLREFEIEDFCLFPLFNFPSRFQSYILVYDLYREHR